MDGVPPSRRKQCFATWCSGWVCQMLSGFVERAASFLAPCCLVNDCWPPGCVEFGKVQLLRTQTTLWPAGRARRHNAPSARVLVRLVNPPQRIRPMLHYLLMAGVLRRLPVQSFQRRFSSLFILGFFVKSMQRMRHGKTSW